MSTDPREIKPIVHGSRLRDAAVNPKDTDFLPPVNAGLPGEEGNPHGPNVYAPGIHAYQGVRPVAPGKLPADPAEQAAHEVAHAGQWQADQVQPDPGP